MFNLALAIAFLSPVVGVHSWRVVYAAFGSAFIASLPLYQKLLIYVFSSFWVPAIVLYVVLTFFRAERFLKPNRAVQVLFTVANSILVVYFGFRTLTAALDGGQTDAATIRLGLYAVAYPCRMALAIACIWLIVESIKQAKQPVLAEQAEEVQSTSGTSLAVAGVALLPPLIYFGWLASVRYGG